MINQGILAGLLAWGVLASGVLSFGVGGCGTTGDAADAPSVDGSSADANANSDADADADADRLSGVYNVETVTCAGKDVPLRVIAKVTFDGASYLEEWTFAKGDCKVTLAGRAESTGEQVTLRDVSVACGATCGGFCDPTHCSSDQTYQYTRTGDKLLLSFTQQGDEFSCGPCGNGVASTYLLAELP